MEQITLEQITSICGIGGSYVELVINTDEKSISIVIDSNMIPKLFSDTVLKSKVSYITTSTIHEDTIKINVVVKKEK